ncbi:MAG: AAA family ATPase [Tatlockia sp.]|nr:AAA family ATPase [Tatlockia sp.]
MNPHIIGISGNMGSGKTTLCCELAKDLNASFLAWDDFDSISQGPEDYVDWYKRGEDYGEWNYQSLETILKCLKSQKNTMHPVHKINIKPTQYIVFDAPLGRLHKQTGGYIGTWFHIEVPLDVSLCRWLLRDFRENEKSKAELLDQLAFYLKESRPLFDDSKYKAEADLVIDGMETTKQQVKSVKKYLEIPLT